MTNFQLFNYYLLRLTYHETFEEVLLYLQPHTTTTVLGAVL